MVEIRIGIGFVDSFFVFMILLLIILIEFMVIVNSFSKFYDIIKKIDNLVNFMFN